MARGRVRIEGLRELDRSLAQFSKATARNVMRRALVDAGQPLADDMRALAPKRPHGGKHMADTIASSSKKPKGHSPGRMAAARVIASGGDAAAARSAARQAARGKPTAEAFVGPGRTPVAFWQEFGTVNHGPQPYVRPAWDSGAMGVLERIRDVLATRINEAVRRAERRAARRARRGG